MDSFWTDHWKRKKEKLKAQQASGVITIVQVSGRLQVSAPYLLEFAPRARELSGRWRPKSQLWSFPVRSERLVLALIHELYKDHRILYQGYEG